MHGRGWLILEAIWAVATLCSVLCLVVSIVLYLVTALFGVDIYYCVQAFVGFAVSFTVACVASGLSPGD